MIRALARGRAFGLAPYHFHVKSHRVTLTFHTSDRMEFVNITPNVEDAVRKSGVQEGLCLDKRVLIKIIGE